MILCHPHHQCCFISISIAIATTSIIRNHERYSSLRSPQNDNETSTISIIRRQTMIPHHHRKPPPSPSPSPSPSKMPPEPVNIRGPLVHFYVFHVVMDLLQFLRMKRRGLSDKLTQQNRMKMCWRWRRIWRWRWGWRW